MAIINFSALMDSDNLYDPSVTTIVVHGRLGNVRWLEAEGAEKRQNGKYSEYVLQMPSNDQATHDIIRHLQEEQEGGAGIWFDAD